MMINENSASDEKSNDNAQDKDKGK